MKLAKIFHRLGLIALWVFLVSLIPLIILATVFGSHPSGLQWLAIFAVLFVTGISFITTFGSFIAEPLVLLAGRAGRANLRRNGQAATATVLDFKGVSEENYSGWKNILGVRAKLKVYLPDGGSFEAVTEDSFDVGLQLRQGEKFPVKYDPRTKEVVLDMPKKVVKDAKDF